MFCLYAIDNVGHGRKLYMQENGFWASGRINPMKFDSEDAAMKFAWEDNPYRIYGAEYYAEEV